MRSRADTRSNVALGLAVCASAVLLVAPVFTGETLMSAGSDGHVVTRTSGSETLLQGDVAGGLIMLGVALAIAAIPVLLRRHRSAGSVRVAAAVLMMFVLPWGYFTIGVFYLPAFIAMLAAVAADGRDRHRALVEPRGGRLR